MLGSGSKCVIATPAEWKHSCTEELDIGAAIRGSFQCPEGIDLAFGLAVAPCLANGVANGSEILSQRGSELPHGVDARTGG